MGPDALLEDDLVGDALVEARDRGVDLVEEHQAGLGAGHGDPVGGVAEQGPILMVGHVDAGDLGRILLGQTDIHERELQVGGQLRRHRGLAAAGAAQHEDGQALGEAVLGETLDDRIGVSFGHGKGSGVDRRGHGRLLGERSRGNRVRLGQPIFHRRPCAGQTDQQDSGADQPHNGKVLFGFRGVSRI